MAVKVALVVFAAIVTDPGTVTAKLLLDKLTVSPPDGAAEVNVTVQESVPEPVRELLLQERLPSVAEALS